MSRRPEHIPPRQGVGKGAPGQPRKRQDISGLRSGMLVAVSPTKDKGGRAMWRCACDCGGETVVRASRIKSKDTKSCGCLVKKQVAALHRKHGFTGTITHKSWCSMRERCNNPHHPSFGRYGARGISVCARWDDFSCFLEDMGERPSKHYSIDRIDPERGYEPSNCRWATASEQNNNKPSNVTITYRGQTKTVAQWAPIVGLNHSALLRRVNKGWSAERCIEQPLRERQRAAGVLARDRLSKKQRAQLALDQDGRCACWELPGWHPRYASFEPCGGKLSAREGIIDEHMLSLEEGGSNDMENRRLFRKPCARIKTDKYDRKAIAKVQRQAMEKGQQKRRKTGGSKWPKGRRQDIPSRGFDKRFTRTIASKNKPSKTVKRQATKSNREVPQ